MRRAKTKAREEREINGIIIKRKPLSTETKEKIRQTLLLKNKKSEKE